LEGLQSAGNTGADKTMVIPTPSAVCGVENVKWMGSSRFLRQVGWPPALVYML